ncbi:MAG: hypothetical protein AMS25_05295 [Gemmatimonas sp. SM23_52]|nr:MAG: hypothetical protein AMS25_05295 [Gemmatimonas sp. SM23_52]
MRWFRARIPFLLAIGLAVAFMVASCDDDAGGPPAGLTVGQLEAFMGEVPSVLIPAIADGYIRLIEAAQGGQPDGVTITDLGGGSYEATIEFDFDLDGTIETTVSGSGSTQSGIFQVTDITGRDLTSSGSITATDVGGFIEIQTTGFEADKRGLTIDCDDESFVVMGLTSPSEPVLYGDLCITAGNIDMTVYFEDDGMGGYTTRVEGTAGGEPFEFTVD